MGISNTNQNGAEQHADLTTENIWQDLFFPTQTVNFFGKYFKILALQKSFLLRKGLYNDGQFVKC